MAQLDVGHHLLLIWLIIQAYHFQVVIDSLFFVTSHLPPKHLEDRANGVTETDWCPAFFINSLVVQLLLRGKQQVKEVEVVGRYGIVKCSEAVFGACFVEVKGWKLNQIGQLLLASSSLDLVML